MSTAPPRQPHLGLFFTSQSILQLFLPISTLLIPFLLLHQSSPLLSLSTLLITFLLTYLSLLASNHTAEFIIECESQQLMLQRRISELKQSNIKANIPISQLPSFDEIQLFDTIDIFDREGVEKCDINQIRRPNLIEMSSAAFGPTMLYVSSLAQHSIHFGLCLVHLVISTTILASLTLYSKQTCMTVLITPVLLLSTRNSVLSERLLAFLGNLFGLLTFALVLFQVYIGFDTNAPVLNHTIPPPHELSSVGHQLSNLSPPIFTLIGLLSITFFASPHLHTVYQQSSLSLATISTCIKLLLLFILSILIFTIYTFSTRPTPQASSLMYALISPHFTPFIPISFFLTILFTFPVQFSPISSALDKTLESHWVWPSDLQNVDDDDVVVFDDTDHFNNAVFDELTNTPSIISDDLDLNISVYTQNDDSLDDNTTSAENAADQLSRPANASFRRRNSAVQSIDYPNDDERKDNDTTTQLQFIGPSKFSKRTPVDSPIISPHGPQRLNQHHAFATSYNTTAGTQAYRSGDVNLTNTTSINPSTNTKSPNQSANVSNILNIPSSTFLQPKHYHHRGGRGSRGRGGGRHRESHRYHHHHSLNNNEDCTFENSQKSHYSHHHYPHILKSFDDDVKLNQFELHHQQQRHLHNHLYHTDYNTFNSSHRTSLFDPVNLSANYQPSAGRSFVDPYQQLSQAKIQEQLFSFNVLQQLLRIFLILFMFAILALFSPLFYVFFGLSLISGFTMHFILPVVTWFAITKTFYIYGVKWYPYSRRGSKNQDFHFNVAFFNIWNTFLHDSRSPTLDTIQTNDYLINLRRDQALMQDLEIERNNQAQRLSSMSSDMNFIDESPEDLDIDASTHKSKQPSFHKHPSHHFSEFSPLLQNSEAPSDSVNNRSFSLNSMTTKLRKQTAIPPFYIPYLPPPHLPPSTLLNNCKTVLVRLSWTLIIFTLLISSVLGGIGICFAAKYLLFAYFVGFS